MYLYGNVKFKSLHSGKVVDVLSEYLVHYYCGILVKEISELTISHNRKT